MLNKKLIENIIALPFNLIQWVRLSIVEKLYLYIRNFEMPDKYIKLFFQVWPHIKPVAKPIIIFLIKVGKQVTCKPIMRAMSTIDHKQISLMYLLFRLFARIMRV